MLAVMIMGGDVHKYPGEYMPRIEGEFLVIVNADNQFVAGYAAHRTVRFWYEGYEPKIEKAV